MPLCAQAQYRSNRPLDMSFEQSELFFCPSFFIPLGAEHFQTASVLTSDDPLNALERNPSYLAEFDHDKAGKAVQKHSSNPLLDLVTLFEISLFAFLTGNADMHLKNISLIDRRDGLASLIPAYSLLSTRLVIPEKHDSEEMALMLNGQRRECKLDNFIDFNDLSFFSEDKKDKYKALLTERAQRLKMESAP